MSDPTTQTLAAAALAYLPAPTSQLPSNMVPPASTMHQSRNEANGEVTTPRTYSWQDPSVTHNGEATITNQLNEQAVTQKALALPTATTTSPRPHAPTMLPSLLQYVDNDLLRRRSDFDSPPTDSTFCSACGKLHTAATIQSTYLPLTCGCWMHYRCFIGHVVNPKANPRGHDKDCCPTCGTQLFLWEGIVALTLAQRTDVLMPDTKFPWRDAFLDEHTGLQVVSHRTAYEADCALMSGLVEKHFFALFAPGAPASPYADGSPDLTACYYAVLHDLDRCGCPRAEWLGYSRTGAQDGSVGFFLFGMLVALKMRGFLAEHHSPIVETEGWADFENARDELQRRILKDVRGGGWSWADAKLD